MYLLAREMKKDLSKKGSAKQKNVLLIANLSLLSKDFPVTSSAWDGTDSLFVLPLLPALERICSCHYVEWRRHLHFSSCPFFFFAHWGSAFEIKSVFSIIWETVGCEMLPSQALPFRGALRAALTYVRTSFFLCNSATCHGYYGWAASLYPEQYLPCRGMLCVKHSCPAHSAVLRQDSLCSASHMEWVPPRCFPAFMKGRPFSSSLGFLELWPLYTKLDYPLQSFISLLGFGLFSFSCFSSCSFFLLDPRTAKQCIYTAARATESASMLLQKSRILS